MLDMDGTVLDLAYDNYMWLTLVPRQYGTMHGMTFEDARKFLWSKYQAIQGDLRWYCLDHWSEHLGLDVIQLHRDESHRIGFLPGAREFLEAARRGRARMLLVTNSHPDTLRLKDEVTGLLSYFDGVYSSHSVGFAKERQEFWRALQADAGFDGRKTLFVDDTVPVLRSAVAYGVHRSVAVTRPDTSAPAREIGDFVTIEGLADLL